jgi:alpha-tubulin suppressor-like RCC1 family protein
VQNSTGAALQGAVDLWVSDTHSCAQLASGALHGWGGNNVGQLGDTTLPLRSKAALVAFPFTTPISGVAMGQGQMCTDHGGKEVACWGSGSFGQSGSYSSVSRPAFVTWQ